MFGKDQTARKKNHRCNEVFDVVQTLLWYLPWDLAGACCCMKCWLSGSSSHKGFVGIFSPGSILFIFFQIYRNRTAALSLPLYFSFSQAALQKRWWQQEQDWQVIQAHVDFLPVGGCIFGIENVLLNAEVAVTTSWTPAYMYCSALVVFPLIQFKHSVSLWASDLLPVIWGFCFSLAWNLGI